MMHEQQTLKMCSQYAGQGQVAYFRLIARQLELLIEDVIVALH